MADDKFDPLKEINNLRDSLGKTIEQSLQTITGGPIQVRLDMYMVQNQVVIRTAAMDGIVLESIDVAMDDDMLTIRGETRPEETPRAASYLLHERRFGAFTRSIRIPVPVKAGEAEAKLKNGSLTITLPIDEHRDRPITVTPVD